LERGDKTVKEFAYEFDCVRGTAEVPDYTLIDVFTKQMPQTVVERLLISCPDFRDKTYEETKDLCIKIDHAVRNPDPLENAYGKKFSKLRIGDDQQDYVARLERQVAEQKEQIDHFLKGAKRWTNSADALKQEADKSSFRPRSGMVCWNCWKPGHSAAECRDTRRSDKERESLRQQLGVPATKLWEEQLQKHSSTLRAAPERILTRKAEPEEEEEEEFEFSTFRGGFSFTAREPEGVCATKSVLDFAKMTKELEIVGVAPAGARPRARRGDPDSLFPDPICGQKPLTELVEWFKSLKPPISMEDLLKASPTYRREFWKYFGSNFPDEAENPEPGRITEEGADNRPRRRSDPRIQESDSESDGEEQPAEPRHRLRNRDIYSSSREELIQELLRRFEDKLRARETREEPTTVVEKRLLAPSLRVAAYAADYWVQDILVDSGAEVSLIEMKGALLIIQASPGIELRTDKSLNIKGVAGKTRTAGYLLLDLDFGQGVKAQEIIYVLPAGQDLVNCTMLLSKPFLASIEAQMDFARDYLLIPTVDGAPVVIQGHRYLGNFTWGTKKFSQSPEVRIKQRPSLDYADIAEIQVDGRYLRHRAGVVQVEREGLDDGTRFVELAEDIDLDVDGTQVGEQLVTPHGFTSEWKGTETTTAREFSHMISPLLGLMADREPSIGSASGEDEVRTEAFKEPFVAGYTTESAQEEGLSAFQVDDATWWVCLEDVRPEQQHRLRELLRRMRLWDPGWKGPFKIHSGYDEFKASVKLAKETLDMVVAGGIVVELR
jgi:hypothetical protein